VNVSATRLPEVLVVEPTVFGDERGYFFESYSESRYRDARIEGTFVQDNLSMSRRGALRGLHCQNPNAQGKLVSVFQGEIFDVAVDVRVGSPRFGSWTAEILSEENKRQLYIPPGFAHGFCVLSDTALFHYKCTDYYHPASELTVAWDDPALAIEWPVGDPVVSEKDATGIRLADFPEERLPRFTG
jgi:dTDP-4-dehydrorhamnose 3,5-epimerase